MEHTEASIEVLRGDKGVKFSVIMPVWHKAIRNNLVLVDIPLFGLRTYAANENDIETSIEEAVKCFCIASEKFGKGIGTELLSLGWKEMEHSFEFIQQNPVFDQIMETGDQYANSLEFESLAIC